MLRSLTLALALLGVVCFSADGVFAAASAQTRVQLERQLPALNFTNVTLKDAIEFLRDVTGANIHVNWKALEVAGVTPEVTINLKLRNIPLRKVLDLLLSEASGGVGLAYYIDDGVIEITTRELTDSVMITRVYPVQDLLVEPPDMDNPPTFGGLQGDSSSRGGYSGSSYSGGSRGGSRGGGGGNRANNPLLDSTMDMFSPATGNRSGNTNKTSKSDELIALITETVYPEMWVANGGKCTIRFFNGNLVVTAPRSVHEAIGGPID